MGLELEDREPKDRHVCDAFTTVIEALKPLTPVERRRVVKAAATLLDMPLEEY